MKLQDEFVRGLVMSSGSATDWERLTEFLVRETRTSLWRYDLVGQATEPYFFIDLLGTGKAAEPKWEKWLELVHPGDRGASKRRIERLARGEADREQYDSRVRNHLGQWVWLRTIAVPGRRDPAGKPLEILGASWEVTEPKSLEHRLQMKRGVLDKLARQAPVQEILQALLADTERPFDGVYAAVLAFEPTSEKLLLTTGEDFPPALKTRLESPPVVPCSGPCLRKELVGGDALAGDFAEIGWCEICRRAAATDRLTGCQTQPFTDSFGGKLGAFCLFFADSAAATAQDQEMLAAAARMAAVTLQRQRGMERLRASEERLERALWGADLGLWEADFTTGEFYFSDHWYRILEYEPGDIPWTSDMLLKLVHPDDIPKLLQRWTDHSDGRAPHYESEHRLRTKSGKWKWVCDRARIVERSPEGKPLKASGTQYDITARKETELELEQSESRFQAFMEHLPAMAFIKNAEGRIAFGNRLWSQRYGGAASPDADPSLITLSDAERAILAGGESREVVVSHDGANGAEWWAIRQFRIPVPEGPPLLGGLALDVTGRQKAERLLRESKERYRLLAENVRVIPWEWSPLEKTYSYVGPQALNVFGWPTESWAESEFWERNVHPDDLQSALGYCAERVTVSDHYELEYRFRNASGGWVWVHDVVSVVRLNGKPVMLRGFMLDITERKRTEAAYRESESRMRSLAQNAPDVILQVNREHRVTFVNREIPPRKMDQIVGALVEELLPDCQRAAARENINRVFQTAKAGEHEFRFDIPDGQSQWYSVRLGPVIQDGLVESVILIARDVTDQRLAHEKIRESEARYKLLADHSSDLITRLQPDGRFAYLSPAAESLTGYLADELIGEKFDVLIHSQDDLSRLYGEVGKVVSERSPQVALYQLRKKDGTLIWCESKGVPVIDKTTGDVTELIVNTRDVTDRMRTARRLREREEQLAHAERLTTMGQMASELAHEINQPLYAIANFAEACLSTMRRNPQAVDDLRNWLDQIAVQARRAGDIVRRVNHFTRQGDSEPTRFDLSDCVREVIPLIEFNARRSDTAVNLELATDLPEIFADRLLIEQVLTNLIRNGLEAVQHCACDRSGRLIIRTFRVDAHSVGAAVIDNGCGIPVENMERLFEPYFTTKDSGTGMGLAICRTLIEGQGGRIWAVNNPGFGATFQFVLPARAEVTDPAAGSRGGR